MLSNDLMMKSLLHQLHKRDEDREEDLVGSGGPGKEGGMKEKRMC
jgi:hypothetical protein